jgi:adenosine kinase
LARRTSWRAPESLVVTRGEKGSSVFSGDSRVDVPAVTPHKIADPTGVGDAYRGGFMKGLAHGATPAVCAQLGSVAATYALEHLGGNRACLQLDRIQDAIRRAFGALTL